MPRPLPIGNKFDRLPPRLREVAIGAYIADDEGRLIAAAAELEARGYLKVGDFLRERALLRHTTLRAQKGATREEQIVRPWRKGLQVVLPDGWDSRRPQTRRTA